MSISSSLNAGVSGLNANSTRLASISDNIANSSTYGYKRVETDFNSIVTGQSSGRFSTGGTRASTHRQIDSRGTLVTTGNATDLAVRGRGMLPVARVSDLAADGGSPQFLMTTTGSFTTNAEGLLTTQSGLVLMGWPADPDGTIPNFPRDTADALEPIQVDVSRLTGDPSTRIDLGINLPATSTKAGSAGDIEQLSVEYFDNLGSTETVGIEFTPTVLGAGASNTWTMTLTDSAQGGAVIGSFELLFDESRATGGTLISATPLSGGTYDPATGALLITVAGGPMEVNIGVPGDPSGISQIADKFVPVPLSKDGRPASTMTGVEVDANGYVHAIYDTGLSRTIYQVPLADVPNANGMMALDKETFAPTLQSGTFTLWDAGDGPTGEVASFAREESTTDVAAELTAMIQTQRAYSSNAKVIQTVDEMLQETTNIKR